MSDVFRLAGAISLFLGTSMLFAAFMAQKNPRQFMYQFLISPALIYLGMKILF